MPMNIRTNVNELQNIAYLDAFVDLEACKVNTVHYKWELGKVSNVKSSSSFKVKNLMNKKCNYSSFSSWADPYLSRTVLFKAVSLIFSGSYIVGFIYSCIILSEWTNMNFFHVLVAMVMVFIVSYIFGLALVYNIFINKTHFICSIRNTRTPKSGNFEKKLQINLSNEEQFLKKVQDLYYNSEHTNKLYNKEPVNGINNFVNLHDANKERIDTCYLNEIRMSSAKHLQNNNDIDILNASITRIARKSDAMPNEISKNKIIARFKDKPIWSYNTKMVENKTSYMQSKLKVGPNYFSKILNALVHSPLSIGSSIIRNFLTCIFLIIILMGLKRSTIDDKWNSKDIDSWVLISDLALQLAMSIDHLFIFITSSNKMKFFMNMRSIIDICTLPPLQVIFWYFFGSNARYYSQMFRLTRLLRLEKYSIVLFPHINKIIIFLIALVLDVIIVILTFGILLYIIEAPRGVYNTIFDFIFFSVVTLTTVGYGDFIPISRIGKFVTIGTIATGFILFPLQVQKLFNAINQPIVSLGHIPSVNEDYILLYGKVKPDQLIIFINELFNVFPNSTRCLYVITSHSIKQFHEIRNYAWVQFKVHLGVTQKHLNSEAVQYYGINARAIYIISDPHINISIQNIVKKLVMEDKNTFLKLVKLQPWCWPTVPISVQLAYGNYRNIVKELGSYNTVSLEHFKLKLVGKSAANCPGFIPLVYNWYLSDFNSEQFKKLYEKLSNKIKKLKKYFEYDRLNTVENEMLNKDIYENKSSIEFIEQDSRHSIYDKFYRLLKGRKKKFTKALSQRELEDLDKYVRTQDQNSELTLYYYLRGLKYHIYRLLMPKCFESCEYSLLTYIFYFKFKIFLIGMISIEHSIYINPVGYINTNTSSQPISLLILSDDINKIIYLENINELYINPIILSQNKKLLDKNLRTVDDIISSAMQFGNDIRNYKKNLEIQVKKNNNLVKLSELKNNSHSDLTKSWEYKIRRYVSEIKIKPNMINKDHNLDTISMIANDRSNRHEMTYKKNSEQGESHIGAESNKNMNDYLEKSTKKLKIFSKSITPNNSINSESPVVDMMTGDNTYIEDEDSNCPSTNTKINSQLGELSIKQIESFLEIVKQIECTKNFILCFGWPNALLEFVYSVHSSLLSVIVILSDIDSEENARYDKEMKNYTEYVFWIKGSPYKLEDLKNAGALIANSIVIFSSICSNNIDSTLNASILVDDEVILARQQILVLYARVENFLTTLLKDDLVGGKQLKLPFIIMEIQSKESLQLLVNFDDIFVKETLSKIFEENGRAFYHNLSNNKISSIREQNETSAASNTYNNIINIAVNKENIDNSIYTINSEYRKGSVYLTEASYSLIGNGLIFNKYSADTTIAENLADGTNAPIYSYISKSVLKNSELIKYEWHNPLKLIKLDSKLPGNTFDSIFTYYYINYCKLIIGIRRTLNYAQININQLNPMSTMFDDSENTIVISCPPPEMILYESDQIYILEPCPKYLLGAFML